MGSASSVWKRTAMTKPHFPFPRHRPSRCSSARLIAEEIIPYIIHNCGDTCMRGGEGATAFTNSGTLTQPWNSLCLRGSLRRWPGSSPHCLSVVNNSSFCVTVCKKPNWGYLWGRPPHRAHNTHTKQDRCMCTPGVLFFPSNMPPMFIQSPYTRQQTLLCCFSCPPRWFPYKRSLPKRYSTIEVYSACRVVPIKARLFDGLWSQQRDSREHVTMPSRQETQLCSTSLTCYVLKNHIFQDDFKPAIWRTGDGQLPYLWRGRVNGCRSLAAYLTEHCRHFLLCDLSEVLIRFQVPCMHAYIYIYLFSSSMHACIYIYTHWNLTLIFIFFYFYLVKTLIPAKRKKAGIEKIVSC